MKISTSLSISLFLITLTGCLQTTRLDRGEPQFNFAEVEPQFEEWEKRHEYGRSLDTLANIDPRDPDYAKAVKLRKQVEKRAADYEQQVLKETRKTLEKGDWGYALIQYDEALSKHPRSTVIKDGLGKLNQQQRKLLDVLERKRLILHGEWLGDVLPIYRDIARVDPRSNQAQRRLDQIISQAVVVGSELALLSNKALANNDLETAEKMLLLAVTLNNDPVAKESLKTLRAQQKLKATKQLKLNQREEKKAQSKQEKAMRSLRDLVKKYEAAFAGQDFVTARKQLVAIGKLDRQFDKLAAMKAELKTAITDKAASLFEAGVSAYSRGEFEQAAKAWRATLKLDAGHQQAKENLQRAEKVLKKLESLKVKQGS